MKKKYTIWYDASEVKEVVVYNEADAIKAFDNATRAYNEENNLHGEDAYIDFTHRDDKEMSFEEYVDITDCIYCDIEVVE